MTGMRGLPLVLCLLLSAAVGDVLDWQIPAMINREQLESVLESSLRNLSCCQVYVVDSIFAGDVLGAIHRAPSGPSLVNGHSLEKRADCKFRIYISMRVAGIVEMMEGDPIWRKRFLMIVSEPEEERFEEFIKQRSTKYIGSARGLLVNLMEGDTVYKYSPMRKEFIRKPVTMLNQDDAIRQGEKYEDFHGRKLRVGTFNCSINSLIGPLDKRGIPGWIYGVEMKIFHDLSKKLNYTYEVKVPPGRHEIGTIRRDGSSSGGIMDMVTSRQVDVAFCGVWLTQYKRSSSYITYTTPLTEICLTFLIPRPVPFSENGLGLFNSFRWGVWVVVAAQTVVVALVINAISAFGSRLLDRNPEMQGYEKFEKSLLVLWAVLFGNAPKSHPVLGPLRHIILWWAITALILNSSFSSSLSSHLTKVLYSRTYETFQELVEEDLRWGTASFPTFGSVFNLENEWEEKWTQRFAKMSPREVCAAMREDHRHFAIFSVDYGAGLLTQVRLPCNKYLRRFEMMPHCFSKVYTTFVLQPESPYTGIFSDYFNRYREAGVFLKEYRDELHKAFLRDHYVRETKIPTSKKTVHRVKLRMKNVLAVFYLLCIGLSLSAVVFATELIYFHRRTLFRSRPEFAFTYFT